MAEPHRWLKISFFGLVMAGLGTIAVVLFLNFWPQAANDRQINQLVSNQPQQNLLVIPKIGLKAEYFEGDQTVLDKGVWHRHPHIGGPGIGNFILTAHRFKWSFNPLAVKEQSILFNIDKLKTGDELLVFKEGKAHKYRIDKTLTVSPNQQSIEELSMEPILTLYSCTLGGNYDGRLVVIAKYTGEIQ